MSSFKPSLPQLLRQQRASSRDSSTLRREGWRGAGHAFGGLLACRTSPAPHLRTVLLLHCLLLALLDGELPEQAEGVKIGGRTNRGGQECLGCLGPAKAFHLPGVLPYGTFFQEGKSVHSLGPSTQHRCRKARMAQQHPAVWHASWLLMGAESSHGSLFPPLSLPNLTPSQSHHKGLSCNLLSWWMMQGTAP